MLKVFYRPEMSVPSGGYSPSADKPRQVVEDWGDEVEICEFLPVTIEDLKTVHAPAFVDGIFSGAIPNGHGNVCGKVAHSTLYTVGSLLAAAEASFDLGVACSPTSGFHHAGYQFAGGFCTFNGLVYVANHFASPTCRVLIVDMDYHYGDGTDDLLRRLGNRSIGHYVGKMRDGDECLEDLDRYAARFEEYDLLLYQAGADPHVEDPLGGCLDDAGLEDRDRIVFENAKRFGCAIAWNLAGGYRKDDAGSITPVLKTHRRTMEACREIYFSRNA